MSGLKSRINKLVRNNCVYFSPAELAVIRDYYLGCLEDEGGASGKYAAAFKEIEACLDRYSEDGTKGYQSKLEEIYKRDVKAFYAWMYKVHTDLHDNHPDGLWLSDVNFISILLQKIEYARRYFSDKRKECS